MTNIDWKYPSRDGWPPEAGKEYLMTAKDLFGEVYMTVDRWSVADTITNDIIAWSEVEPAKPLD